MHIQSFTILSALALSTLASPVPSFASQPESAIEERNISERATSCVPAVVFAVRGSDPQQTALAYNPRYSDLPTGMINTANAVISKNGGQSSTGLRPLNYPAIAATSDNLANQNYHESVNQGIGTLQQTIQDYVNACSTGKIFVMGYSQGAQVVGSALGGSPSFQPLKVHGRVTGTAIYADPTFIDNLNPIDQGNGAFNGINGRAAGNGDKQRYLNSNFANRLQTYCQLGDQFCDTGSGADAGAIHGNATTYFQQASTTFLTSF